jgi:hypothetical protein
MTTDEIKELIGIPSWVDNNIIEQAAADVFQNIIEENDRKFKLKMADDIWIKVKGFPIPDCYSEEDRLGIYERYYHRAVAMSQGE